jgi:hypothetical protein
VQITVCPTTGFGTKGQLRIGTCGGVVVVGGVVVGEGAVRLLCADITDCQSVRVLSESVRLSLPQNRGDMRYEE